MSFCSVGVRAQAQQQAQSQAQRASRVGLGRRGGVATRQPLPLITGNKVFSTVGGVSVGMSLRMVAGRTGSGSARRAVAARATAGGNTAAGGNAADRPHASSSYVPPAAADLPGRDVSGLPLPGAGPHTAGESTSPGLPSSTIPTSSSRQQQRTFGEAAANDMSPPAEVENPVLTGAALLAGQMGADEELPGDEVPPQHNPVFDRDRITGR